MQQNNAVKGHDYVDDNFNVFNFVKQSDILSTNNGLNDRALTNQQSLNFETDCLLQALNLIPDDPEIPLIDYKNPNLFLNMTLQGL